MRELRRIGCALTLVLAACGGTAENAAQPETAATDGADAPEPADPALAPQPAPAAAGPARRCGWLHNPTPGNWWLADRDGQWILMSQGGHVAEGIEEMPDMTELGWERTNGSYGHGCACLTVIADAETGLVTRLADPEPKPLAQCRADRSLPSPQID